MPESESIESPPTVVQSTGDRAERVRELFDEVVELDVDSRKRLLDDRCANDHVLRSEVEALLMHDDEHVSRFLRSPLLDRLDSVDGPSITMPAQPADKPQRSRRRMLVVGMTILIMAAAGFFVVVQLNPDGQPDDPSNALPLTDRELADRFLRVHLHGVSVDGDPPGRLAVDHARSEAARQFEARPLAHALVNRVIADAYRDLGDPESAAALLEPAVTILSDLNGPTEPETIAATLDLARAWSEGGHVEREATLLRTLASSLIIEHGESNRTGIEVRHRLALSLHRLGESEGAASLLI